MSSLLTSHFLGIFPMKLGNITLTQLVRTLSLAGHDKISRSFDDVGYLEHFAPAIAVRLAALPQGEQLTKDDALKLSGRVLDSNHRVTTLKNKKGPDAEFLMRVFREFGSPAEEKLIANREWARNNYLVGVLLR